MPAIEVRNLQKAYGGKPVLRDVSLTVEAGEIFGIIGPNGAGKTTTVECLSGLVQPDGGTVRVLGLDPGRDRAELTERVGVQLQKSELPARLRVGEVMDLYASFYRRPADTAALLARVGLAGRESAKVGGLSGGQRQRLSIAMALIGSPEIAILDELTTGLDPEARRATWELVKDVRDSGVTIVLVTHFMEEAEYLCDRLAIIEDGRTVGLGSPAEIARRGDRLQRIRFRSDRPVADDFLRGIGGVTELGRDGSEILLAGTGNLLLAVTTELDRAGIAPVELSLNRASLEEAILSRSQRALS